MVLLALLIGAMAFVLWYVIDRRAKNRGVPPPVAVTPAESAPAAGPVAAPVKPVTVTPMEPAPLTGPAVVAAPAQSVDLGGQNERKTIDFSSGKPVVKDSAEDKTAIDAALKDMAEATKDVTFEAPKKKAEPAATPPKN